MMHSIIAIFLLFQVFVPVIIHSTDLSSKLSDYHIRQEIDGEYILELATYLTLSGIKKHVLDDESINKIRLCYLGEENNYKRAVDLFTEDLNRIFNDIKELFEENHEYFVSEIQTQLYDLLNKVRKNPFELDVNFLKPGKYRDLVSYLWQLRIDVSKRDYNFKDMVRKLWQSSNNDFKLGRYYDRIHTIHEEAYERTKQIMERIEKCFQINTNNL